MTRPVTVVRDGHDVIAHYGSVATEVAVCVKHAGVVQRPELGVLELSGDPGSLAHLLDTALGKLAPAVGAAVEVGGAWCAHPADDCALIVAPQGSIGRWRRLVQRSIVNGRHVTCEDVPGMRAVSLIGPRAGRVLVQAGVGALPMPGAATAGALGDATAVVVCEASDRFLVLVDAAADSAAWQALAAAGAPYGLAQVGHDAFDRLSAAARPARLAV